MRLWAIIPAEPITDDRAYLIGYLKSVFNDVEVSFVARAASYAPEPKRRPDLILNLIGGRSQSLLDEIDAISARLGVPVSPQSEAAAKAEDKRTYIRNFFDLSPETRIARNVEEVRSALADFGEIVIKDPFGMRGIGVERLACDADLPVASDLLINNTNNVRELIVQPYLSGFAKGDKRIIVQRSPAGAFKIIGQIFRKPRLGQWKSSLRSTADAHRTELTNDESRLALEIAARAGLDNATLDIGEHEGRLFYMEHNQGYGGLIDFDLDRSAQGVRACADFLLHLAQHGRPL